MRTALPIPAFARGRPTPPRRQCPYHVTIERILKAKNDPNAFVEAMLRRELWMPSPRTIPPIDWSALPSRGEFVMVPAGRAMSGKTPW